MYTDWKVGDEIKICVSADMFCGQQDYLYFINDFDIQKTDTICSVQYGTTTSCLDGNLNNLSIKVYTVDESFGAAKHGICSDVPDNYKLRYLGNASTNSDGVCTISTVVTEQDLTDFDDTPEGQYKLFICIEHEKVAENDYISSIMISPAISYDIYTMTFQGNRFFSPEFYNDKLQYVTDLATEVISDYTDYSIEKITFNSNTYILKVIIKTPAEEIISLDRNSNLDGTTSLIVPIFLAAYIIGAISLVIAGVLFVKLLSTEKSIGIRPESRQVSVRVYLKSGDNEITPSDDMEFDVYSAGILKNTISGNDILEFMIPSNESIVVEVKDKDNKYIPYSETIEIGIDTYYINAVLTSSVGSDVKTTVRDEDGNLIEGKYMVLVKVNNIFTELQKGVLINGIIPEIELPPNSEILFITNTNEGIRYEYKTTVPGDNSIDITVEKCETIKNTLNISLSYISKSAGYLWTKPDKIEIKQNGINIIEPITIFDTALVDIDGLDKGNFTVYIYKQNWTIENSGVSNISFMAECPEQETKLITFKSEPPADIYDITIDIENSKTNNAIENAKIYFEDRLIGETGIDGRHIITEVVKGKHTFGIVASGYENYEIDYDVNSSTTLEIKLEPTVFPTSETLIVDLDSSAVVVANRPIKFYGKLINAENGKAITGATIIVNVENEQEEIVKEFTTILTSSNILSLGKFETAEWIIPKELAETTITVCAKFDGDEIHSMIEQCGTLEVSSEPVGDEECFIDNPFYPLKSDNPCLISDTQATWIKYGAIGIAGLYVFYTVAPIIKGTGKIFEKKVSK